MKTLLFIVFVNLFIVYLHINHGHTVKLKSVGPKRRPWRKSAQLGKNSSSAEQRATFRENVKFTKDTIPIVLGTPKCAEGFTFCEDVDMYPYEQIKNMLRKHKKHKFPSTSRPPTFETRVVFGEPSSCPSKRVVKYPRVGKTKNNTWEFIVNQEDYVQAVYIKICSGTNKSCQEEVRFGYIAECKQKYAYQKLRSPQNNNIVTKAFTMPKDCVCAIKRDPRPFARTR